MTLASSISATAAALEILVAVLCLGFGRAPGWRHLRLFGLVALTAAAYSLASVPQTLSTAPSVIVPTSRLAITAGALHALAWLHYSAGHGAPPRRGRVLHRLVGAGLAGVALLGLWPGALARATIHAHDVPALGLRYHTADVTPLGGAAFLLVLLAMVVPAGRYLRGALAGVPGSWPHLAGFAVVLGAAVVEALTAGQLLAAPYLLDVGFLVATLTIGAELVGRATGDAERLTALSERLERTVEERTAQLARAHQALAQQDRLAALGRLAGGVAHQINSPLSAIAANAGFLHAELGAAQAPPATGDLREAAGEIGQAAQRIREVVLDLALFSRGPDRVGTTSVELRPVIDSAVRLLRHELGQAEVVAVEDGGVGAVEADPARLVQVLFNLLTNAAQALPAGCRTPGAVVVRTRRDGERVLLEVEDRGPGIPREHLGRVLEPYFTTNQADGASGLGLSVTHGLVRAMGGQFTLESEPGRGTRAQIRLPAGQALSAPRRSDPAGA